MVIQISLKNYPQELVKGRESAEATFVFCLWKQPDLFDDFQKDIDALVHRRNSIAHGNFRSGVTAQEFSNWEVKVSDILSGVTRLLYDYANNEKYLV